MVRAEPAAADQGSERATATGSPRDGARWLLPAGLTWYGPTHFFATGDQPWYPEFHWHGLQLLAGNSFVLAGLIGLAALCVAAFRMRYRLER